MRALIVNCSPLTDFDGKTLRLVRYAKALGEMGYDIDFLTSECRSLEIKRKYRVFEAPVNLESIFDNRYRPILTEISNTLKLAYRFCFKVFSLIKGRNYSIVLSSFNPPLPTIIAILMAKLMNIPHVYDYDDLEPEMSRVMKGWSTAHPFYRTQLLMEKIICRHSDATFVMSEMMKKLLVRTGVNEKMEVIHNVPSSQEFKAIESMRQNREKLGIAPNLFVFAYLGNIQRQIRGLETLVDGVDVLKNNGYDEDFLVFIIGTGTGERELKEKISRLGLSKYYLLTGDIPKEEAVSYLNAANVSLIILPAVQADYMAPTKLFISIALGKHIIATDSKEIRRILGSTPIFLRKNSTPKEIAEAMLKAKRRYQQEDIDEKYRRLFVNRYCWEKERENFVKTVKNLVNFV